MKKLLLASAALLALTVTAHADIIANLGVNPTSGAGAFSNTNPGTLNTGSGAFIDAYEFELTGGLTFFTLASVTNVFASADQRDDIVMQNGDVVYVDRMALVYIYGEVQRPGSMRLERDMSLMQALASGGGLTLRGTQSGVRVHRRGPDGRVEVITPALDDKLKDADVVYVRESLF